MSKVKVQGYEGATGVLTIASPNTNSDRTITLPDATGTLLTTDGSAASLTGIGVSTLNDVTEITVSASEPTVSTNPAATGYLWINKTLGKLYVATDVSAGANVWTNIGGQSGDIS